VVGLAIAVASGWNDGGRSPAQGMRQCAREPSVGEGADIDMPRKQGEFGHKIGLRGFHDGKNQTSQGRSALTFYLFILQFCSWPGEGSPEVDLPVAADRHSRVPDDCPRRLPAPGGMESKLRITAGDRHRAHTLP
jgi:hypothetical protein